MRPVLSLISLAATGAALGGVIALGRSHDILNSRSLASVMLYVAGASIALLCALAGLLRHEGRWSWVALAAIPLLAVTGWMLRH